MGLREFAAQIAQETQQENPRGTEETAAEALTPEKQWQRQADLEREAAGYREHLEAIKQCAGITSEIYKGLAHGENTAALLLKAMRAISILENAPSIYSYAEQYIITVYGHALHDAAALEVEAGQVSERLAKLEQAEQTAATKEDRERIQAAIKAHRQRLEELKTA